MKTRRLLLATSLVATLAIALAATTASANNLSSSSTGVYIDWPELTFAAGGFEVICNVELLGTFHTRTIAKQGGALIGHVLHVDIRSCTGGTAELLQEELPEAQPWHVTYEGFDGSLPNPTGIDLLLSNLHVQITPEGGPTCLADPDSNASGTADLNENGEVTSLDATNAGIGLQGGFLCSLVGSGEFTGDALVETVEGERLVVDLI